jgi:tetratricopeptide (TPR) repeat protein
LGAWEPGKWPWEAVVRCRERRRWVAKDKTPHARLDFLGLGEKNRRCRMPQPSSAKSQSLTRKEAREMEVSISFLEGLLRRDPDYVEALQILGDNYTQRGDYPRSLQVDRKLSQLQPDNPLVFYNLACSHSLNGDIDEAATALEQALRLGYRDFKWLSRDPDLVQLRRHPRYRRIRSTIRKIKIKIP